MGERCGVWHGHECGRQGPGLPTVGPSPLARPPAPAQLTEAERELKRVRFEEALALPEEEQVVVSDTIVLEDMAVEESYSGPRMEGACGAEGCAALPAGGGERCVVALGTLAAWLERGYSAWPAAWRCMVGVCRDLGLQGPGGGGASVQRGSASSWAEPAALLCERTPCPPRSRGRS